MSDARSAVFVGKDYAPALGDIIAAGGSDTIIFVQADAVERPDWARYAGALMVAMTRGVEIHTGVQRGG